MLKVRVADSLDQDFIEIEIPHDKRTYNYLLLVLCEELELTLSSITRVRKLPNTRLRNDNDVKRLKEMQELEVVCSLSTISPNGTQDRQPAITVFQNNRSLNNGVYY